MTGFESQKGANGLKRREFKEKDRGEISEEQKKYFTVNGTRVI